MSQNTSIETQQDALKVAKSIQKSGQSKEQTKLIAQGIEKGISEYKKQQKAKARERDKQRKQQLKVKNSTAEQKSDITENLPKKLALSMQVIIPWGLLILSWLMFSFYILK